MIFVAERKGEPMQKQKFDEIVSYFNKKVSEMEIETKYKMELLGMVTALGHAHEKETHEERTETHGVYLDVIDRSAAQTELMMKCERYTLAKESHGLGHVEWSSDLISVEDAMNAIRWLPSAQPAPCEFCKHNNIADDKACLMCSAERRTDEGD